MAPDFPGNQYGQSVKEQRWPWFLAAGVMLASAVAAAWSTYLYWLPCRGSMLEGTLLQPFSGDGRTYEEYEKLDPAVKASMDACLRRMDGDISGQAPWTSELLILAMALVGLAWLTLVFCVMAAEDQGGCGSPRSCHSCYGAGRSGDDRRR